MTDKTQPWGLPTIAAFGLLVVAPSSAMAQPSRTKPVVIRGSWGGLEVARRLTIEFMDASRQGEVRFLPCDSRQVADRLASRECDVGLVLHSLAPTTRDVVGEQFSVVHLGRFAVGIVVNKRNSVSSIATTQLGDVYRGKITSWSGVRTGRRVGQIEIYSLLLATTESHLVRHNTMQGEGFAQKLWDGWPEPSRQKLSASEVTAAVIEKPHAIGFFLLGPDTILDDRIRVLAIGGDQQTAVLPTLETIAEGTYPIIDQLTFFLHPDAPPAAREFVAFATGPEGAAIVREYGLWPERELEEHRAEVRLKDMKAGKGAPVVARGIPGAADAMAAAAADFVRAKTTIQFRYQSAEPGSSEKDGPWGEDAGLFVSDRPLPQSESSNVESAQLADRAVAIVAHRTNAVDRLTVSELRDVFAGKVINWPEETRRIELYGLSRNHELAGWFEQKIVGPTREARVRRRTSTAEVIEAVAASAVGIGFVDVAQIGPAEDRVKVVGLIPPDAERVLTPSRRRVPQDYPLAQPLLLYLSPEADGTTREFFDFLAAGGGRESLQKHGYVPSPPHRRLGGPRVSFSSRSAAREQQESESGGFLKEGG